MLTPDFRTRNQPVPFTQRLFFHLQKPIRSNSRILWILALTDPNADGHRARDLHSDRRLGLDQLIKVGCIYEALSYSAAELAAICSGLVQIGKGFMVVKGNEVLAGPFGGE